MKINCKSVLQLSFFLIYFASAIPQHSGDQLRDLNLPVSSQGEISSHILSKCLCVPYYRCDPGHWEKTEHDHCTRFMYVCCYGSEAVEYAMNQD